MNQLMSLNKSFTNIRTSCFAIFLIILPINAKAQVENLDEKVRIEVLEGQV